MPLNHMLLYTLDIDQGYLAHTSTRMGVSLKKVIVEIKNLAWYSAC